MVALWKMTCESRDDSTGVVTVKIESIHPDSGEPAGETTFAMQILHDFLGNVCSPPVPWPPREGVERKKAPPREEWPALADEIDPTGCLDESWIIPMTSAFVSKCTWNAAEKLLTIVPTHRLWTTQFVVGGELYKSASYRLGENPRMPGDAKAADPLAPIDRNFPPEPVSDLNAGFELKLPKKFRRAIRQREEEQAQQNNNNTTTASSSSGFPASNASTGFPASNPSTGFPASNPSTGFPASNPNAGFSTGGGGFSSFGGGNNSSSAATGGFGFGASSSTWSGAGATTNNNANSMGSANNSFGSNSGFGGFGVAAAASSSSSATPASPPNTPADTTTGFKSAPVGGFGGFGFGPGSSTASASSSPNNNRKPGELADVPERELLLPTHAAVKYVGVKSLLPTEDDKLLFTPVIFTGGFGGGDGLPDVGVVIGILEDNAVTIYQEGDITEMRMTVKRDKLLGRAVLMKERRRLPF